MKKNIVFLKTFLKNCDELDDKMAQSVSGASSYLFKQERCFYTLLTEELGKFGDLLPEDTAVISHKLEKQINVIMANG